MVSSMTGFGRGEFNGAERRIVAEIKSVNNRYLDINIRMPRMMNGFDAELRKIIKTYVKRGKVDVYITYDNLSASEAKVRYHPEIAGEYVRVLREMAKELEIPYDVTVTSLSHMPDVFKTEDGDVDEEALFQALKEAVQAACEQFAAARQREGAFLVQDLTEKTRLMEEHVAYISSRAPEMIRAYENKLKERIRELIEDRQVDEGRLLTEVAIFSDKTAVDEELVRLKSHIEAVRAALEQGDEKEGIGRKLDFIVQELNREANTILSKSADLEISNHAVEIKTLIEKIREQIQNLE